MSPARQLLGRAVLFGCLLVSAACDTDFSPGWEEQLEALMDAGAAPSPPTPPPASEDAGVPDAQVPPPAPPAVVSPERQLVTCVAVWRCDRQDPTCQPLCVALSMEIESCPPGGSCNAHGHSPVACKYCAMAPIK